MGGLIRRCSTRLAVSHNGRWLYATSEARTVHVSTREGGRRITPTGPSHRRSWRLSTCRRCPDLDFRRKASATRRQAEADQTRRLTRVPVVPVLLLGPPPFKSSVKSH